MSIPPSRRHQHHSLVTRSVTPHDIQFLFDVGAFFDHQPTHFLAFRAGLVRDQLHAHDLLSVFLDLLERLGDLDAAALAATAGMDLCLDDPDRAAQGFRGFDSLFDRHARNAARYGHSELSEDFSCLDAHGSSCWLPFYLCGELETVGLQKKHTTTWPDTALDGPARVIFGHGGAVDAQGVAAVELKWTVGWSHRPAHLGHRAAVVAKACSAAVSAAPGPVRWDAVRPSTPDARCFRCNRKWFHEPSPMRLLVGRADGIAEAPDTDGIGCGFGIDDGQVTVDRDAQLSGRALACRRPLGGEKYTHFHIAGCWHQDPTCHRRAHRRRL